MKRIWMFALLLLLSAALAGCACEHQWTQPDCINGGVCLACDAAGEAALGHDWTDVSCAAPQTCRRCGEIRGEALAHSYGDWSFGQEDMTHTCAVCGFEERTELDRGLFLQTLLPGHWDFYGVYKGEEYSSAKDFTFLDTNLFFGEDHSVTFTKPDGEVLEGSWRFALYGQEGDTRLYSFILEFGEREYGAALAEITGQESMLHIITEQEDILFCQNRQAVSEAVGNWVIRPNKWGHYSTDQAYWCKLNADRTAAFNLGQIYEGIWHLVPLGTGSYGVVIEYEKDGQEELLQGTLRQDNGEYAFWVNNRIHFGKASDQEYTAVLQATDLLVGKWTSEFVLTQGYTMENADEVTAEYSITFFADGTFTAEIGGEHTGTWYVSHISDSWEGYTGEKVPYYFNYRLYFDGQTEETYGTLDARSNTSFSLSSVPGMQDRHIYFDRLTQEDIPILLGGVSQLVGTWQTPEWASVFYSLTFCEDGTVTGVLDREISGVWKYYEYDSGGKCRYRLHLDDTDVLEWVSVEDGQMHINGHPLTKTE